MQDEALADARRASPTTRADRARCACTAPSGTRASSASSRRGSRTASTARRSCSRRGADGELRGSGRSIAGFHLRDALDLVAKRAPGHDRAASAATRIAAGLSLRETALAALRRRVRGASRASGSSPAHLDAHARERRRARAPASSRSSSRGRCATRVWGQGFPPPRVRRRVRRRRAAGRRRASTPRLTLARGGERFEAILFRHADPLPPRIRAAYRPEVNHWQGTGRRCSSSSSTGRPA